MTNLVLSVFAFAVLAAFLGVLVVEVPRLDLGAVVGLTLLLVGIDLFGAFRRR